MRATDQQLAAILTEYLNAQMKLSIKWRDATITHAQYERQSTVITAQAILEITEVKKASAYYPIESCLN